jgi:outer membrane protein assembly factor BamA
VRRRLAYLIACVALCSCSVTRHVADGDYFLSRSTVHADRTAPRDERIEADELERFVRQRPSRKLLRTNIPAAIYSASDTLRDGFVDRLLRTVGSAPVVLDTVQMRRSATNIEGYLRSRGFYDSRLEVRLDTARRRARVAYCVTQGVPWRIGEVDYLFRDESLRDEVLADTAARLVRSGDIFDLEVLDAERSRIANSLRNRGYYRFSASNVEYLADSAGGRRTVDLTIVVRRNLAGYNASGEPEYEPNRRYLISEIFLDPDYNAIRNTAPDTVAYRGFKLLTHGKLRIRPRVLARAVDLRAGQLYDASAVERTYADLMRLDYFRSVTILFSEQADDMLRCTINAAPGPRQSFRTDLEGSISSNFLALGGTVGYQNRNLLRGSESFDASFTARREFLRTRADGGSYEVGGGVSLTWPRLLAPLPAAIRRRIEIPRTRLEMSLNYQSRPIYERTLSGARLAYSWSNRHHSSFIIRPVDVNLIDVKKIDAAFLDQLRNPYLRNSYRSQLVPGMSLQWTYNSQLRSPDQSANSLVVRLNAETMGNLFAALSRMTTDGHNDPDTGGRYYNVLGMRFSQYARVEMSVANRIATGHRTSIAWRVLAGGGVSYGNATPIPVDRLFYSGGSNSMRGWIVRRLGPGTLPYDDKEYPSQVGNMKLEANVEFRFPVWDFVHSAVFLDAGNIWFVGRSDYEQAEMNDATVFRFNNFYRQLGLNTGLGVRLDFDRFIFRVDWGVKLHDPGAPAHSRWIRSFRLRNTALNFGVGYPF